MRNLRPLASLLIATALLLTGHGLHMTLLPLRAGVLGFDDTSVGLTASAYYIGFVTGCFVIPRMIARVGHIRIFAALLAVFASTLLLLDMTSLLLGWLLLRFTLGAMMCGAYTVIESWLTDQTPADARGRVLASYTFLVLAAMTLGQFLVNLAPITSSHVFMLAAILVSLAIVPVTLTKSLAPAPVPSTKLSFTLLYRRSRSAFAGGITSGVVMGSFWSLGALYAMRASGDSLFVAKFISAVIIGGALAQYPVGMASDRLDRRVVLAILCACSAITAVALTLSSDTLWLLMMGFLFGASANAIYAVSLAKAADNAAEGEFVTIASSVLLLNSLGAATAPLVIGQLMGWIGDRALFQGIAGFSAVAALYMLLQARTGKQVNVEEQIPYVAAASETAPASFDNDPRSPEESEADLMPMPERPSIAEFDELNRLDESFAEEEE